MLIRQGMEILSNNILLANDIVIMGNTQHGVITRMNDLIKAAKKMGLEVNQDKTKYLIMSKRTI